MFSNLMFLLGGLAFRSASALRSPLGRRGAPLLRPYGRAFAAPAGGGAVEVEWSLAKVRRTFVEYFEGREHEVVPSSGVVPFDDPTLLFCNAGMNQFKPVFLGLAAPGTRLASLRRATNAQKCVRAGGKHNDLEDVGLDTYHHTFFEMLGSWSFGDYFKEDAIAWARELLVDVYGLDETRLYATYFGGDEALGLSPDVEARDLWLAAGFPEDRVLPGSKADNFWEMGDAGPCGPCTELHYDCLGGRGSVADLVNEDDPTVIEIWNLVFIQFEKEAGSPVLKALPQRHVDTGLGLERLTAILQGKPSNYDTDAFAGLFAAIHAELPAGSAPYGGKLGAADVGNRDTAYRAIADHARCLAFCLADGAVVSNEGRGYVLRRILRRAVRYGATTLGARPGFMGRLAAVVADEYGAAYPEVAARLGDVAAVLDAEEAAFAATLERGVEYLDGALAGLAPGGEIDGETAFFLYDSLGFPADLTAQMAGERGHGLDAAGFDAAMAKQVATSRADRAARATAARGSAALVLGAGETAALAAAGVGATDASAVYGGGGGGGAPAPAKIAALFVLDASGSIAAVDAVDPAAHPAFGVVLGATPFYAEAGGQAADGGGLAIGGVEYAVRDVQAYAGYVLHTCTSGAASATVAVGDAADPAVDGAKRAAHEINHSMTHALNWALWRELGDGVAQRGSSCDASRLRFDFSHGSALTPAELAATEARVEGLIARGAVAERASVALDDALAVSGLRAVFGEAYPDPVQVVAIGLGEGDGLSDVLADPTSDRWSDASLELCGGTHVGNARDAQAFVITKEEAVAKGVRRIEAVTAAGARAARAAGDDLADAIAAVEAAVASGESAGASAADAVKALRVRVDATTCSAAAKPAFRSSLDAVGKTLAAADKAAAGAAAAAGSAALLAAAEAAAGDRVVYELDAPLDGKAAAKLAAKLAADFPAVAVFAVAGGAGPKLSAFCAVPPGHAIASAPAWLGAALDPLGGRGGGKPAFAQGSAPNGDGAVAAALRAAENATP